MARIKLELPEVFPFRTSLTVRVTDLNYGNHLGNDAVLGLIHEARVRYLAGMGYSELDVGGVGIIMADVAIVFKAQGFLGEELTVLVVPGELSRCGFELLYLLRKADGSELARAKTGIACYDYQEQAVVPLPERLRGLLGS
jgi:acyl-CoA thioesterase FadM